MKKLMCTSCGAELKIEDNKEYAVCEHCKSKYKLNEDLNINIKIDDSVKDVFNDGLKTTKKLQKFILIPIGLFIIVVASMIIISVKTQIESKKKQEEIHQKYENEVDKNLQDGEKIFFNLPFTSTAGTKTGFLIGTTLDSVVKSNKTNDKQIFVVYNNNSTNEENKIIEIKHELGDYDKYEVSVNYDNNGYVNEIKIVKIS